MSVKDTLLLLEDIENRCHKNMVGLPIQEEIIETWEGIILKLGDVNLALPIGDALEILNIPSSLARVPGAKPWVLGVANIRAQLLPILDLKLFLLGEKTTIYKKSRVLVINRQGINAGILLDQVIGMKHFPENKEVEKDAVPEQLVSYILTAFEIDDTTWNVFNINMLAENQEFRHVSDETH